MPGEAAPEQRPPADAGHRVYSPLFLRGYDLVVLGLYSSVVWRCPARDLVTHYARHLGERHLDVGPGTGYFLERARRPDPFVLTLLDPNRHVLDHAARRLAELRPTTVRADARAALPLSGPFDSAALNHVLHCIPGRDAKAAVVRNVATVLAPDGRLFGATILGDSPRHTRLSRLALRDLNRKGIFANLADDESVVRDLLEAAFTEVELALIGTAAVFAARCPRPPG